MNTQSPSFHFVHCTNDGVTLELGARGEYTHADIVELFVQFLRGCGYTINGEYVLESGPDVNILTTQANLDAAYESGYQAGEFHTQERLLNSTDSDT